MPDGEESDAPTRSTTPTPSEGNGDAPPDLTVSWRGIVEQQSSSAAPAKKKKARRILNAIGGTIQYFLEVLGLRRRRNFDGTLQPRPWKRMIILYGGALGIFLIVSMVHIVPAGTVAVPVTFGSAGAPMESGLHVTAPWPITTVNEMSVRTENYTMVANAGEGDTKADDSVSVLGRDGGSANVDSTVLYRVDPARASDVYANVGTDYLLKVIRPSARNCIRTEFTNFDLVAAATDSWKTVSGNISECMRAKIEPQGIKVEDFQLREVSLGEQVQKAIDAKVSAQQEAQRQQFDLLTSQQKADITRTDAQAQADAQQILACGGQIQTIERGGKQIQAVVPNPIAECSQAQLTPEYLQYQYILALKSLVNSPNNSTIILPFDQNLTPLLNLPGGGNGQPATTPNSTPPATSAPAP